MANPLEPKPSQCGHQLGWHAQRSDRQPRNENQMRPDRYNNRLIQNAIPGNGMRGSGCIGHRRLCLKPVTGQAVHQRLQQCGFTAPQMRASSNVEPQPIGRINRNKRRGSLAPTRKSQQRIRISIRLGLHHMQLGSNRQRLRHSQAGAQAKLKRQRVGSDDNPVVPIMRRRHQWRSSLLRRRRR